MNNKLWNGMTTAALAALLGTAVNVGSSERAIAVHPEEKPKMAENQQLAETTPSQPTANLQVAQSQPQAELDNKVNSINKIAQPQGKEPPVATLYGQAGFPTATAEQIKDGLPLGLTTEKPKLKPTAPAGVKGQGRGMASWYGPGFHGRRTASGERFNQHGLTAAHRSLPFGTLVRVTNVRNGRSVVVRINDRGPHARGRVIDLSAGAAKAIGVFSSGVAPVRLDILGR